MARRLPSLNALRAFEAAARHVSFTLAAAELNVTHAAVSRHIRELEAWLGAKLFHRTGRGVEVTEAGQELLPQLTVAFDQLAAAVEPFARSRKSQDHLVISSDPAFAALWLVPRLGGFAAKHPHIDLVLDPTSRLVDFFKGEADLGIRYGGGSWKNVVALRLAGSLISPVCSPSLLKRYRILTPGDLAAATLLQEESKQHWRAWLEAAGAGNSINPTGPILKGHLAVAAAEAGQGFALADNVTAGDSIIAGRLVRPFDTALNEHAYYVVRGQDRKESKSAVAFRLWLMAEMDRAERALTAMRRKQGATLPAQQRKGRKR